MSNETSCPNNQELERLMLGQLPESDTARLAGHIESCDQCVEAVRTLMPNDTLVAAMKHSPTAAADLPVGEQVQSLIEQVRSLVGRPITAQTKAMSSSESPALPLSSGTAQTTIAGNDSAADSTSEVYDFLAPPQSSDELGRLGPYRVLTVLGSGGMGVVFMAEDTHLQRKVALKAMKPALAASESAKKRFLREARAAAAIEHDHIIGIYQVGEDRGVPYLAMPLLRGESLEERLSREGRLSVEEALRIGREIADGLAAAHDRGLMHRDIKPGNVWLEARNRHASRDEGRVAFGTSSDQSSSRETTELGHSGIPHAAREGYRPRVKILDFGLARAANDVSSLTQSGAIAGTPAYMAPEQAQGEAVDQRCDLFSLGCVLYRCVTGLPPFHEKNAMAILMAVIQSQPQPVREFDPSLPIEFEKLISRLLEKDPGKRFPTAHEVIAEISNIERQLVTKQDLAPTVRLESLPETVFANSDAANLHPTSKVQPVVASQIVTSVAKPLWPSIALATGALLLLLLSAVIYRIQTDKGTLIVSIEDEAVEAKLKQRGLVVRDATSGRSFTITAKGGQQSERTGEYRSADDRGLKLFVVSDEGLEVSTNEFKLTRGSKVRVKVTLESSAASSTSQAPSEDAANSPRRVCEWALSVGGSVSVRFGNGPLVTLEKDAPLPVDSFRVIGISVAGNQRITDADLDRVVGISEIETLNLDQTSVTDAALAKLKDMPNLMSLHLSASGNAVGHPAITDAGLIHIKVMKKLKNLDLNWQPITDAGLVHVRDLQLRALGVGKTGVTDQGLAHLKNCSASLVVLTVGTTQISDEGLKHLAEMKNLEYLSLTRTKITNAGLQHLSAPGLETLNLRATALTDDGLEQIKRFPKLKTLNLREAKVTADGVAQLSQALPNCRIEWDGGVIEPVAADRQAAIQVVKLKGVVTLIPTSSRQGLTVGEPVSGEKLVINGRNQQEPFDQIPEGPFTVTQIDLRNDVRKVLPSGSLEPLAGLHALKSLKLEGTEIDGDGLKALAGLTSLESLHLGGCKLNDADLVYLKDLTNLTDLNLDWNADITGAGFMHLKGLKKLKGLSLYVTNTTDAGLEHLINLPELDSLVAHGTKVTGTSFSKFKTWPLWRIVYLRGGDSTSSRDLLPALKNNPALQELALNMAWTDDDLAHLATNKELRSLTIDDGKAITNRGLAYLSGLTKLRLLDIRACQATDDGIDHLLGMKDLDHFAIPKKVTDKGLAKLRALKNLRVLGWGSATDDSLVYMKDFPNLGELWLQGSPITDDGLRHLHGLPRLAEIGLTKTRVTRDGIKAFRASYQRELRIVQD